MAITHVGSTKFAGGTETTGGTITIHASTATGDDLYCLIESRGHNSGHDYPTCTDNDSAGNTWTFVGSSANRFMTLYWKKATSATASKTITIAGALDSCSAGCTVFRGALSTGDPTTNLSTESNSSGDETHTGFTPDYANSMICLAVGQHTDDRTVTSTACTTPGALTSRFECTSTGGNDCAVILASAAQSGGPTATGDFTWAQTNASTRSMVWAVRPDIAAPTVAPGTAQLIITGFAPTISADANPPVFLAAGPVVQGTGSVTVAAPASGQADHIEFLFVRSEGTSINLSSPQDFVEIDVSAQGTGSGSNITRGAVYWRRLSSGSMGSPTATATGPIVAQILRWGNCDEVGPPWDTTVLLGTTASSDDDVSIAGGTTTVRGVMVITVVFHANGGGNIVSGWTNTDLTSVTERTDVGTTLGFGGGFGVATGLKMAVGSFGATTALLTAPSVQALYHIALAPSGSAVATPDVAAHRYWRILMTNTPGPGPDVNEVELVERDSEPGALGSSPSAPATMHPSVTHLRPVIVANWNNDQEPDGELDLDSFSMTLPAGQVPTMPGDSVHREHDTLFDSDGILLPTVRQSDGAGGLPLVKGVISGFAEHGDTVNFETLGRTFQTTPKVTFRGGFTHEPRSVWGTSVEVDSLPPSGNTDAFDATKAEEEDCAAVNAHEGGFTVRARLRQRSGAVALRDLGFQGTNLDTVDDTDTISTITNASANDDRYRVRAGGQGKLKSFNGFPFSVSLHYVVETTFNSWADEGTIRANGVVTFETTSTDYVTLSAGLLEHTIVVAGLSSDGTDQIRWRLTDITTAGYGDYVSVFTRILASTSTTSGSGGLHFVTGTDSFAVKSSARAKVEWEALGYL